MGSLGQAELAMDAEVRPGTALRIIRFAVPFAGQVASFLTLVILNAILGIMNPLIYRNIIDNGILKANTAIVIQFAILAVALGIFDCSLFLARSYLSAHLSARVTISLRTKLFDHIQRMPLAFFSHTRTGALVSRLDSDVTAAQNAFTDIVFNLVGNFVTIVMVLTAMFILSWKITAAAVVLFLILILPARIWNRKLQELLRESYDLNASMKSLMVERFNVAGAHLVKLFGQYQEDSTSFRTSAIHLSDIGVKCSMYGCLASAVLMLMGIFATSLAYGWGGVLATRHQLDLGYVVAFVSYLTRLYGTLAGLSNVHVSITTALVSFGRVFEVLDLEPMIKERPNITTISDAPAKISFDHVSFSYPTASEVALASLESVAVKHNSPGNAVLDDITFTVEPGQLLALVGPSGAGKTTITHLISRLYDVQRGSVSINSVDVRDTNLDFLRRRIGVVTQDAHLFHDTIRANLLYAKPDATRAELIEVLRTAQILPLIESLPNGLDAVVGDRGYHFSGGEKQRLAIARLLLKSPEIVILDEATAHLDLDSEAALQRAFDIVLRGRTSIVIAHRLSTVRKADQILVMREGRIVERGTHSKLLAQCGYYAELYQLQFAHGAPEYLC